MDDNFIEKKLFFALRGSNKREIFLQISKNGPITQAKIFTNLNKEIERTHIGRVVRLFLEENIISCLNSDERTYKLYILSNLGKKMFKKMKSLNIN